MRAIMQGLTDAEFERLYGTEEQCRAALGEDAPGRGHAVPGLWQREELRVRPPGRLHAV